MTRTHDDHHEPPTQPGSAGHSTQGDRMTNLIHGNDFPLSPLSDRGAMQLLERSCEARVRTDLGTTWDLHYNREAWARDSLYVRMGTHTGAVPWSRGSVR